MWFLLCTVAIDAHAPQLNLTVYDIAIAQSRNSWSKKMSSQDKNPFMYKNRHFFLCPILMMYYHRYVFPYTQTKYILNYKYYQIIKTIYANVKVKLNSSN